jgi:hypothetical protein
MDCANVDDRPETLTLPSPKGGFAQRKGNGPQKAQKRTQKAQEISRSINFLSCWRPTALLS